MIPIFDLILTSIKIDAECYLHINKFRFTQTIFLVSDVQL